MQAAQCCGASLKDESSTNAMGIRLDARGIEALPTLNPRPRPPRTAGRRSAGRERIDHRSYELRGRPINGFSSQPRGRAASARDRVVPSECALTKTERRLDFWKIAMAVSTPSSPWANKYLCERATPVQSGRLEGPVIRRWSTEQRGSSLRPRRPERFACDLQHPASASNDQARSFSISRALALLSFAIFSCRLFAFGSVTTEAARLARLASSRSSLAGASISRVIAVERVSSRLVPWMASNLNGSRQPPQKAPSILI
jgi:hypothetical protein